MNKLRHLNKIFFFLIIVFSQPSLNAQNRDHLPYSVFGIGEFSPKGFGRNLGMGKTGIALASDLYLNNVNPAASFLIDSISFFFTVGVKGDFVSYSTTNASQYGRDINLSNIAMGFRVNKFWSSGVGVEPFSTVAYKIASLEYVEGSIDRYLHEKIGSGGLSRFYWDNSVKIMKNLSLGVSASYIFGNVESTEKIQYPALKRELNYIRSTHYNQLFADFGIQYRQPLGEKLTLTLGGIYGADHRISYRQQTDINDETMGTIIDSEDNGTGNFRFPMHYGGGLAVNYANILTLTGDYIYEDWSKNNTGITNFQYTNSSRIRLGVEIVPGGDLITPTYFGMIRYRAGFYSDQSYITVGGHRIKDTGLTLGFSFPFLRNKSTVNVSVLAGQYGTLQNSLIRERYIKAYLSFELHDWWFLKSQYN